MHACMRKREASSIFKLFLHSQFPTPPTPPTPPPSPYPTKLLLMRMWNDPNCWFSRTRWLSCVDMTPRNHTYGSPVLLMPTPRTNSLSRHHLSTVLSFEMLLARGCMESRSPSSSSSYIHRDSERRRGFLVKRVLYRSAAGSTSTTSEPWALTMAPAVAAAASFPYGAALGRPARKAGGTSSNCRGSAVVVTISECKGRSYEWRPTLALLLL